MREKETKKCRHFFIPISVFNEHINGDCLEKGFERIKKPILVLECLECKKIVFSTGKQFK